MHSNDNAGRRSGAEVMKYRLVGTDGQLVVEVELPGDGGFPDADIVIYHGRYFQQQPGGYGPVWFQETTKVVSIV